MRRCALTAVPFPRAGLRRVKIKRESDGAVVGELKTEKKEGLEEGEALWVKGDGSGLVKRRWGGGGGGGRALQCLHDQVRAK